jgi:hypothetical protein
LAWPAAIEFPLNVIIRQINARRTTVHYDSDPAAMGFAEGGNAKKVAKTIAHKEQNFIPSESRGMQRKLP